MGAEAKGIRFGTGESGPATNPQPAAAPSG